MYGGVYRYQKCLTNYSQHRPQNNPYRLDSSRFIIIIMIIIIVIIVISEVLYYYKNA